MAKRYRVTLTAEERDELARKISRGKADARKLAHARVLLQADEAEGGPARVDEAIASAVQLSVRTIDRAGTAAVRGARAGGGAAAQAFEADLPA